MPAMTDGQILKVDDKGRIRIPRERREALLEEFGKSGMTATAFAKWAGIKYPTFVAWVRKGQEVQKASAGASSGGSASGVTDNALHWVEAVIHSEPSNTGTQATAGLVVQLPCGARMEVKDNHGAALVAEILRQLARSQAC